MKPAKRVALLFMIVVLCVGCDQASKAVAKSVLPETGTVSLMHDAFRFHLAFNDGAFMGLGAGIPQSLKRWIFSMGVGSVLLCLGMYVLFSRTMHFYNQLSLSFIIAGGCGNLIDRIVFDGKVVDFMRIGIGPFRTGIFNFADIAITLGVIMLLVASCKGHKSTGKATEGS